MSKNYPSYLHKQPSKVGDFSQQTKGRWWLNCFLKCLKFLSELQWRSESNDSAQLPRINFVYIIFALTKRVTSIWPLVMQILIQKVTNANVVTPIKVETFKKWLLGFPKKELQFLYDGFIYGFKIPFQGERKYRIHENFISAEQTWKHEQTK